MLWVDWLLIIRAIWGIYKTAMASNNVLVCALEACARGRKAERRARTSQSRHHWDYCTDCHPRDP
jgi:hypothetical protein